MLLLLSLSIITVSLLIGGVAAVKRQNRRQWQARERARMREARQALEEARHRQRSHDFLIDEALLTEAFTERKTDGSVSQQDERG